MERSAWKRALGPALTLVALALVEIVTHGPVPNASVGVVLYLGSLALVVVASSLGGTASGSATAALLSIYVLRFTATAETGPIALTAAAFTGLGIMALISGALVATTRALAARQERLQAELERKNVELEANRRILEQAETLAGLGSWEVDARTGKATWSDGMYRLLRIPKTADGEAPVHKLFAMMPPEVQEQSRARLARLQVEPFDYDVEYEIVRADGTRAWVRTLAQVQRDEAGKPILTIGSMQDITRDKELARVLEKARAEAESAAMAKAEFLANMSHEIRTPMNAVIGMTSLLLDTKLDDEQRDHLETIRTSGEHLLTIINDILDFSKIESGHLEIDRHVFEPERIVEEAMELVTPALGAKPIELLVDVDPGVPRAVVGDAGRLRQIFVNLLSNAVKFTREGEIVVSLRASEDAGRVRLHASVRDTGIGIPADRVGRLFKAFSQADTSTTREFGGTGLGLAISKRLVELMGGTIRVEGEGGRGTTFAFDVFVDKAPPGSDEHEDHVEALRGARLLLVDDNETNLRIVSLKAERWGLAVRQTTRPAEALAWIERGDPFEVVMLDYQMPAMDGVELATRIRALRPERPPIILLASSVSRPSSLAPTLFAATITKPLKMSVLYNTLSRLLEGRARRTRAPASAPAAPGAASALRVLLTEDNSVNQKVATRMLEKLGYRADVAANGQEAIDALARQPYDVVLMDVQMPVMDGLEATREICRRWPTDRPRIIGLTAHALEEDERRCREAGMDDYVSKPIQIEALRAALERARPR